MTSFDPRTWLAGHATPIAPEPVAAPQPGPRTEPGKPAQSTWFGFVLSALILLGGAAAAYAMRPAAAAFNAATEPASASG